LPAIADHGLGEEQEPRTNPEIGTLRHFQIDIKSNLAFLEAETDHAALLDKIVGFADGEDRGSVQAGENCGHALFVSANNKKEMAAAGAVFLLKVPNLKGMRADLLSLNGGFEKAGESILSRGAKDQGTIPGANCARWPIHELSEMKNESGLQLILSGIGLRVRRNQGEQVKKQNKKCEEGSQGEGRKPSSASLDAGRSR